MDDKCSNEDIKEIVKRFEQMLKTEEFYFFDVENYEAIIMHYKEIDKSVEALKACELAINQYPFSTDFLYEKVQLLSALSRLEEALSTVEYLENIQPNNYDILLLKETIYVQTGDYVNALHILKSMLDLTDNRGRGEIFYRMGFACQNMKKYEEAIGFYKKAIKINPYLVYAVHELNHCLDSLDELEKQLDFYIQFTDKDPYSSIAWYNLGLAYTHLEEYENAIQAFDYAAVAEEGYAEAHFEMGNCYMELELYKDAQKAYTDSLIYDEENPDLLCSLGAAYEKTGDFVSAIINYKEAVKMDSSWSEAWYGLGVCLMAQQKWLEAIFFLKKAIQLNEKDERYWLAIADTEYQLGNVVASLEAYQKSEEIFPHNPDLWLNWSYIFHEQGEEEKSVQLIEEGIEECPEEAKLYYRAVAYLLCAGNYHEALDFLEKALALDYEQHTSLFDFFENVEMQKAIYKIIQQIREK